MQGISLNIGKKILESSGQWKVLGVTVFSLFHWMEIMMVQDSCGASEV